MNKLINYMISNNLIPVEDRELYAYGLKQGAIMLLNIVTTLIIGAAVGMVWQSILFTCAYIPLRSFAGGYHARTQTRCYFISSLLVFFCVLLIKYLQNYLFVGLIILVFSGTIIFLNSPLADDNKPLQPSEFQAYRIKARKILCMEMLVCLILFLISLESAATCIVVALALESFMLMLHKVLHRV